MTQEAKHTLGPWRLLLSDNATPHIMTDSAYTVEDHANLICAMPAEIMMNYNSYNNSRLIVAAPELLVSLKSVTRICEAMRYTAGLGKTQMERIEKAKAVIAKAEGRAA